MTGVQFTENDIKDKDRLMTMIEKEAQMIFNSSIANRGRTLDDIKQSVKQGKIAELWLIENYGFLEADKKWHDLKNAEGEYIEVKAYHVTDSGAPYVQKDIKRIKDEKWNTSKWYMLFKYDYGTYFFLEKIQIY